MKKFIKFLAVGVANTIIGLSIIFALYNLLHFDYRLANVIGYAIAFINSFILNKFWTFKSQKKFHKELPAFLLVFIICYLINLLCVIILVEAIRFDKNLAQLVGMIVYTGLNFIGNKYITFK